MGEQLRTEQDGIQKNKHNVLTEVREKLRKHRTVLRLEVPLAKYDYIRRDGSSLCLVDESRINGACCIVNAYKYGLHTSMVNLRCSFSVVGNGVE